MNEEGLKNLPEAIHDWDEVKNSDTPEVFWDRVTNMRSKFGTGLFKPGEDAGSEDWGKFTNKALELSGDRLMPKPNLDDPEQQAALYRTLGMPTEAKDYEFAEIEGSTLPDERKEFLSKIAHDLKLTKSQLKGLDTKVRQADIDAYNINASNQKAEVMSLKQEWGLTFDERVHAAKKIASTFFPHLGESTQFSAAELKSFYSIAKQFGQNSQEFKEQGNNDTNNITPADAAEQISAIRNNKEHPYNKPLDPAHKVAKEKMHMLYMIKTGEA